MPTTVRAALITALVFTSANFAAAQDATRLQLNKGDRIVLVGDTFAERAALYGYIETLFHCRHPELQLTFRNLGYSADTVAVHVADLTKGTDRDDNRESNRALNFGTMHKHLTDAKADVILICFGLADSFAGPQGVDEFKKNLKFLIKEYGSQKYNGASNPRLALVGPIAHEKLGGQFPDPIEHNKVLKLYSDAMRQVAAEHKLPFVDLLTPTAALMNEPRGDKLTFNGIHLTQYGYWAVAPSIVDQLTRPATPPLAKAVVDGPAFSFDQAHRLPPPPEGVVVHPSLASQLPGVSTAGKVGQRIGVVVNDKLCVPLEVLKSESAFPRVTYSPMQADAEKLRWAVVEQNQEWFYKWRAVNGEYIYGRRAKPFGVVNFPGEMKQLDAMCVELDKRIHQLAQPTGKYLARLVSENGLKGLKPLVRAEPTRTLPNLEEIYKQKQGIIGGKEFPTAKSPEEAIKLFKLQDGYEINLFASERDFPLHNPVAMAWDTKGRLWVTTMPAYPHYLPGVPPNDKILILEDTDGDGKADKCTVFADKLYLPTGIEFGDGGVYVGAQPNLLFLKDNDGDDVADERRYVLHGFGSGDSHHAVHAFTWTPEGALLIHEGIFHRTNVETPWGVLRQHDAGIYRFQPKNHKLETYVSYNFANPWGHVFDRWGYNFIADASGGANYNGLPLTGYAEYPRQHPSMKVFTSVVRPTCGCELISSRHFPPEAQGNFLVNNNITFQGTKQHQIIEEGSGYTSKEIAPLVQSFDPSYRPVAIKHGPDGAIYIVDWFNPLVGHMQFSIRDPGRDHYHGRIWRITAKNRPLVKMPKIHGQPIPKLLDCLKEYENLTRYLARMELRERKPAEVAKALDAWVMSQKEDDPEYEHHLLEALWIYQGINEVRPELLKRLLRAKDAHARAGATRALRYWKERLPDALELLQDQVNDVHPRVRLEGVVALSFFGRSDVIAGTAPAADAARLAGVRAADIALQVLKHPTDYYLDYGLRETLTALEPYWKPHLAAGKPFAVGNPAGANYLLASVSTQELTKMPRTEQVMVALLSREGVLPQYRKEALEGLAKEHKTDFVTELLAAIERIDKGGHGHSDHVLFDLAHLLAARSPKELRALNAKLEKLALAGRLPLARQVAYVALVTADQTIAPSWAKASQSVHSLRDLVDAVPLLPDPKLRQEAYPKVKELLHGLPESLKASVKSGKGTLGRYVRIDLPGKKKTLTLAEVQVFSNGVNVAPQGKATQKSTAFGGDARRAIDGNTSGKFADGGQTHSKEADNDPWWEVDLGREVPIEAIVVWNRTDDSLGLRLEGFKLSVLDAMRHAVVVKEKNPAPRSSVRFTLDTDPAAALKLAALSALPSIPGVEEEVFTLLAKMFVHQPDASPTGAKKQPDASATGAKKQPDASAREHIIKALRTIPRAKWPQAQVKPLADAIVAFVAKVPVKERTELAVLEALQLGNDLATLLPAAEGKAIRAQLGELGVQVVLVRTIPHLMAYDRTKIYVEAGKPAVIVFENNDIMPHNLVIGEPGSLAAIGLASETFATNPDAIAKGFVPPNKKILHHTRMLQPREVDRIQFVAPQTPGEYVYVCTFPGHWRVMHGTLHVVPKLADVPPHELNPPTQVVTSVRPFVRNWTVEELTPGLINLEKNRSFEKGKELFKVASCIQCHKMNGEGGQLGPDLAETAKKLAAAKMSKIELLTEIIEPSKKIDDKYRPYTFITGKGDVVSGLVLSEDKKLIRVQNGPNDKPRELRADDIEEKTPSKISIMPNGLVVTLTQEEILDLLAYIVAGGQANHPAYQRKE